MDKQLIKNKNEKYILITLASLFVLFILNYVFTGRYTFFISGPIMFDILNYLWEITVLIGLVCLLILNYKNLLLTIFFLVILYLDLLFFHQFPRGCIPFSFNYFLISLLFFIYLFFIFKNYLKIRKVTLILFGLFFLLIIARFCVSENCDKTLPPWEEPGAMPCIPIDGIIC